MDRNSEFEKELELEVVKEEDPLEELFRPLRIREQADRLPINTTDALEQAAYGDVREKDSKVASEDEGAEVTLNRVDTLRDEEACPFGMGNDDCGLEQGSCSVCGYESPPEGLDDPDLDAARKWDEQEEKKQEQMQEIKDRRERVEKMEQSKLNRPGRPSFASADDFLKETVYEGPLANEKKQQARTVSLQLTAAEVQDILSAIGPGKLADKLDYTLRDQVGHVPNYRNYASTTKMSPAKSKAQFRLMKGICEGNIEPTDGITKKVACEFVKNHQSPKGLPEKIKKDD